MGVSQGYLYPYLWKATWVRLQVRQGRGFYKNQQYTNQTLTHVGVHLQNWPGNLTTAMRVSIDIAVQHCKVRKVMQMMQPQQLWGTGGWTHLDWLGEHFWGVLVG